jgi:hypothetical protein
LKGCKKKQLSANHGWNSSVRRQFIMPSRSKSVKRYNLVNSRSLVLVHLFGGLPPCPLDFCWLMCRLLSTLLPSQSSSLTEVSDVHSVLIDRYDSVQLKIDGFWTEYVPIDELIAGAVPCCSSHTRVNSEKTQGGLV